MTEQQFLEKVQILVDNLPAYIMTEARKILKSGAVNLEKYENNYRLPKNFVSAMGAEIEFQHAPISAADKREVRNLKKII